ncbi:Phosphatidylinositide phosphatase SAC2 [Paramyrothecium foliicola]|nr:Phosphatidylinositide phosphatase SAC2 [Paramyrothecium foliicola]
MPGLARKIIICAAIDGIIIQPLSSKGQRPFQPVRVKYGDASVSSAPRDAIPDTSKPDSSFEAFGVIGLVTVSKLSYLITITRRQQVAQIFGHPIYVVTEVAVTPCTAKADAEEAIRKTSLYLQQRPPHSLSQENESSDEDIEVPQTAVFEAEDPLTDDGDSKSDSARSSVAEDVIRRRGSYGRFAHRWFSRSGWTLDQKRTMGMSNSPELTAVEPTLSAVTTNAKEEAAKPPLVSSLLPKLLRTVQILFGTSHSFYFSYDVDITRSLSQQADVAHSQSPLHTQVDRQFFWNRHIIQPFLETGQDALGLPLMQGFVGQRTFTVDTHPPQVDENTESLEMCNLSPSGSAPSSPKTEKTKEAAELRASEKTYLITLVSRRSTKRAGLRYLRRGVDEDGYTANSVETEQILSPVDWTPSSKMHSFVQIRGSIPLFFTQSPYSLKPAPVIQHSEDSNYQATKKHFEQLAAAYNKLQIVNLVEKHGIEEPVGSQYQKNIERLNGELDEARAIAFEWFDFHRMCRGMKFENVSYLLLDLKDKLEELGSTTREGGVLKQKQQGVIRTNCMDCLDRTNVCQSSFGKHMLELQLKEEGYDMSAQLDQATAWFNTLWADNGDAVSKQYASTAAMKGDYTRTRKRDYRGALNDLGLSLTRFYSGMVNDFFSQAAIDFLLGNSTEKIFDEFEADMMTKDPAVSMTKMREQAVELCQRRVVADEGEEFHGGWVLLSPHTANTVKSWPMEEVVLLLTDVALYVCRFDWNSDKVSSFERLQLRSLTNIKHGPYILSTTSPSHMDESKNVGFVITYEPGKNDVKRTNTRTMSNLEGPNKQPQVSDEIANLPSSLISLVSGRPKEQGTRTLAFKAPYAGSSVAPVVAGPQQTEVQQVSTICTEIERLALDSQLQKEGEEQKSLVERGDIISLEEAKRNTGLLEQLGHSIKKLVWA